MAGVPAGPGNATRDARRSSRPGCACRTATSPARRRGGGVRGCPPVTAGPGWIAAPARPRHGRLRPRHLRLPTGAALYRRIAFAAADLSLAVAGVLLVWGFVRPHEDIQRLYAILLGFATLLVGSVQLAGAMNLPAAAGQTAWRRLRPRWPVIMGVVVIALITAGIGLAAAAITSPDPQSGSEPARGPVREPDLQPVPQTVPRSTAPATVPRRPP